MCSGFPWQDHGVSRHTDCGTNRFRLGWNGVLSVSRCAYARHQDRDWHCWRDAGVMDARGCLSRLVSVRWWKIPSLKHAPILHRVTRMHTRMHTCTNTCVHACKDMDTHTHTSAQKVDPGEKCPAAPARSQTSSQVHTIGKKNVNVIQWNSVIARADGPGTFSRYCRVLVIPKWRIYQGKQREIILAPAPSMCS